MYFVFKNISSQHVSHVMKTSLSEKKHFGYLSSSDYKRIVFECLTQRSFNVLIAEINMHVKLFHPINLYSKGHSYSETRTIDI